MENIILPEMKKVISKNIADEKLFESAVYFINHLDQEESSIYIYTSYILSKYFDADINMIVASLIYGIVNKFNLDDTYVKGLFNDDILQMVKILNSFYPNIDINSSHNKVIMIKSVTKDVRVTIIKLIERFIILQYEGDKASDVFITDTLNFYAPLAKLLGIYELKNTLENLCFRFNPNYNDAKKINNQIYEEYDMVIRRIKPLFSSINVGMLKDIKFEFNNMSMYDIFLKSLEFEKRVKEMNDRGKIESSGFCSIKCLVNTREECYKALCLLHQFKPVMGTFVDCLSGIKENETRLIYTEVFVDKCLVDFRICTKDMDRVNSYGLAINLNGNLQQRLKDNYTFYSKLLELENSLSDNNLVKAFEKYILKEELYNTDSMELRKEKIFKILYGDKN